MLRSKSEEGEAIDEVRFVVWEKEKMNQEELLTLPSLVNSSVVKSGKIERKFRSLLPLIFVHIASMRCKIYTSGLGYCASDQRKKKPSLSFRSLSFSISHDTSSFLNSEVQPPQKPDDSNQTSNTQGKHVRFA